MTADSEVRAEAGVGIAADQGLAMFDIATSSGQSLVVPVRTPPAPATASGDVPALLRDLVSATTAGRRRGRAGTGLGGSVAANQLTGRLAAMPEADRLPFLVQSVLAEAATVLGHATADRIGPRQEVPRSGLYLADGG